MNAAEDTLLAFVQRYAAYDTLPTSPRSSSLHPFSAKSQYAPLQALQQLAEASSTLSSVLSGYASGIHVANVDSKLVSNLRQCTTIIRGLHVSEQETRRRVDTLTKRSDIGYGALFEEPIPLDREYIPEWCLSRIETWGTKAGMEAFTEDKKDGRVTMVLGGKVLVIDVELIVERTSHLRIVLTSLKTSHALPSGTSGVNALAERSASLDEILYLTWGKYLEVVQRDDTESSMQAAHIVRDIQSQLAYLMKLDELASHEGDKGIRWFSDVGLISSAAEIILKTEAGVITSLMQRSQAVPLDVFLNRTHALPLPYLTGPSMSFLAHLSPLAYYTLLVSQKQSNRTDAPLDWRFDIHPRVLRDILSSRTSRPPGATIATLTLSSDYVPLNGSQASENISDPFAFLAPSELMSQLESTEAKGPSFHLPGTSLLSSLDHTLPEIPVPSNGISVSQRPCWVLDFTEGGATDGIVMSHTRMKEIQRIVLSDKASVGGTSMHQFPGDIGMQMPYPGSWVGLLLHPNNPPSERYIATYTSPSGSLPPLRLRLTSPNEAGFFLGKVPVKSLREVLAILEIVRDQCWINESLGTCDWIPEDRENVGRAEPTSDVAEATEEELSAILNGTIQPTHVPVNVFIPFTSIQAPSALESGPSRHAPSSMPSRIIMTLQVRESSDGATLSSVSVSVAHDRSNHGRGKSMGGVRVEVAGTLPYTTQQSGELEELVRRGAVFGVAGRVWKWTTQ